MRRDEQMIGIINTKMLITSKLGKAEDEYMKFFYK